MVYARERAKGFLGSEFVLLRACAFVDMSYCLMDIRDCMSVCMTVRVYDCMCMVVVLDICDCLIDIR